MKRMDEASGAVKRSEVARRIADELAGCGVKLVASLPDNWISELLVHLDGDGRFRHVPVNREESAIGLCSGAYMAGLGSAGGVGAFGLMARFLAARRTDELVVTSAGNSGQAWWAATRDAERSFYLDASMSLSTMFASGIAAALPQKRVWAFMGDGAFCMNPGMLMVERQMNLPNLTHFLVSNRAYGATSNARLPNSESNDYVAIARGCGLTRIHSFASLAELERGFDAAVGKTAPGHTMVVLEVEPFSDEE